MSDIFAGFTSIAYKDLIMITIGIILIYLAIKKEYEPMLLLPIGFGILLTNLPLSVVVEHEGISGFLKILFDAGITNDLFPVLIFIAVGAMVDFTPLFKMPVLIFYGAACISAFPMAARVINKIAQDEDPKTVILMQSVSANVSGQLGSIIAGGLVLALIPLLIK